MTYKSLETDSKRNTRVSLPLMSSTPPSRETELAIVFFWRSLTTEVSDRADRDGRAHGALSNCHWALSEKAGRRFDRFC
jgi:hypothetical protein